MANHRLTGTHTEPGGMIGKHRLYGLGFGDIAGHGRGAVSIDIVDSLWIQLGAGQGVAHTQRRTGATGRR